MLRLITFIVLLATLSFSAAWLADNEGAVTLEWLGYRVDTSVMFLAATIAAIFVLILLTAEIFLYFLRWPRNYGRYRKTSNYEKAFQALTKGFTALAIADHKNAQLAAREARKLLPDKPIALILAAEVAKLDGDTERARKHFATLLEHKPTEFFALKGLLDNSLQEGDAAQALAFAEQAYAHKPNAIGIIQALLKLYKQSAQWDKAELLLEQYGKHHPFAIKSEQNGFDFAKEKAAILTVRAKALLDDSHGEKTHEEEALTLIEQALKAKPSFLPAAKYGIELAQKLGKKRKAVAIIERVWKQNPHPELGEVYLKLIDDLKGKSKIKRANKLLLLNPNNKEGHRVVAKAALSSGDVTTARNHVKLAIGDKATVSLCRLMIEIEQSPEGGGQEVVKEWEEQMLTAAADPMWTCHACGHITKDWAIECPHCGAIDSVAWGTVAISTGEAQKYQAQPAQLTHVTNA